MTNPLAAFVAGQTAGSYTLKAYAARGLPTSTSWTVANIATIFPSNVNAQPETDRIYAPNCHCAATASNVVAIIGGRIRSISGALEALPYFARFYRSADGGATWSFSQQLGADTIIFHPAGPGWGDYADVGFDSYCPINVVYRTTDSCFYAVLVFGNKDVHGTSPAPTSIVVYKSSDSGATWTYSGTIWGPLSGDIFGWEVPSAAGMHLIVDNDGTLYFAYESGSSDAGVYWSKSSDGATWSAMARLSYDGAVPTNLCCWVRNGVVVIADDYIFPDGQHIYISLNGGSSWSDYVAPADPGDQIVYPRLMYDGGSLHLWGQSNYYPKVQRWSSADYGAGGGPSWSKTYDESDTPTPYATRSRCDYAGAADHIVAQLSLTGSSLKGLVWDTSVLRSTIFWTQDTGLTIATQAIDVCGYWGALAEAPYTYFF